MASKIIWFITAPQAEILLMLRNGDPVKMHGELNRRITDTLLRDKLITSIERAGGTWYRTTALGRAASLLAEFARRQNHARTRAPK